MGTQTIRRSDDYSAERCRSRRSRFGNEIITVGTVTTPTQSVTRQGFELHT